MAEHVLDGRVTHAFWVDDERDVPSRAPAAYRCAAVPGMMYGR